MKMKGLIFVFAGMLLSFESMAASVCYSEDNYPAVHILGLNDNNQPRLALVGKFADRKNKHIPFLEKTDKGWVETTDNECKPFYRCLSRIKTCHVKGGWGQTLHFTFRKNAWGQCMGSNLTFYI